MPKTASLVLAFALSSAALAQQPRSDAKRESPERPQQSAAAGASGLRCDFMSREEMLMCTAAPRGGVSGARSSRCDTVSADTIERCLMEQESVSSDPANEFRSRSDARAASG